MTEPTSSPLTGWRRAVLECSLRPFAPFDAGAIDAAAHRLVEQWLPLLTASDSSAVLLWASDGSELLEWAGDLDTEVEWACWVGFNNTDADPYGHNVTPERRAVPYCDAPAPLRYRDIQAVVAGLRRALLAATGRPVEIGAIFDSGPEFAPSRFKFETHPEIVAAGEDVGIGRVIRMVRPWNRLHADRTRYAAFPDGIDEGLSFGGFLGRQASAYLPAMGFDYLWFSNGFGFSSFAWTTLGELYDAERFHPERRPALEAAILEFWADFHRECELPIEVRGTNFTAGLDAAVDGVPGQRLYDSGYFRLPPPNSPWGPLNRDFGIELTGQLSRIATLPGAGFPFRFYAHDPWFWQNPWRDFYGRQPFDIALPLALSRVDATGAVQPATDVEILTADDELGQFDARDALEIQAALAGARAIVPDAAGPVVWLYPFREYHQARDAAELRRVFEEEWLFTAAVNVGLPLSSVVSTDAVEGALAVGALQGCVVVTPHTTALCRPDLLRALREAGIDLCTYQVGADAADGLRIDPGSTTVGRLVQVTTGSAIARIDLDENGLRSPVMARGASSPGQALVEGLSRLGVSISWAGGGDEGPVLTLARHAGGLQLAAYCPDDTLRVGLRLSQGAPVFSSHEVSFDGSRSWLTPGRSWSAECRILVDQAEPGVLRHRELSPTPFGRLRRFEVSGLVDATVTLLRDSATAVECTVGDRRWTEPAGAAPVVVGRVSGAIEFSW